MRLYAAVKTDLKAFEKQILRTGNFKQEDMNPRKQTPSPLLAVVQVRLSRQNGLTLQRFKSDLLTMPEVAVCLQISGAYDFLLHVSVCDMKAFQSFLFTKLSSCQVVSQTDVSIVMAVFGGAKNEWVA